MGFQENVLATYARPVGDAEVLCLLDGYFPLDHALVTNLAEDALEASVHDAHLPAGGPIPVTISVHVIRNGGQLTLIDSGAGTFFGPTSGKLTNLLTAVGIAPANINRVLLTHMHPDHIGGLVEDGSAVFHNASVHVNAADFGFWTSQDIASQAPEEAQPFFALARGVSAAYGDRIVTFEGATDLGGGLVSDPMPGHTPGHTGFQLSSGNDSLLIWGDAASVAAYQFRHPDAGIVFDIDGPAAAATRREVLNRAAADRIAVASTHLPFPGFGFVEAKGDAFAWVPEEWHHG